MKSKGLRSITWQWRAKKAYLPFLSEVKPITTLWSRWPARKPILARSQWRSLPAGRNPAILKVLEHLRILQLFKAVVTSEDVAKQKPAPDIFLEAARQIGVEARFCRA